MTKPVKKQIQLFLLAQDEQDISEALHSVRPGITFLDDNVWDGNEPTTVASLDRCQARLAYIWDRAMVPNLPTMRRKDGRLEGPISGVVIQVVRSQLQERLLLSGRFAAGTAGIDADLERAMAGFITDVWTVLGQATEGGLAAIDKESGRVVQPRVREYRAGHCALRWINEDSERWFKDRSTPSFFRVQ